MATCLDHAWAAGLDFSPCRTIAKWNWEGTTSLDRPNLEDYRIFDLLVKLADLAITFLAWGGISARKVGDDVGCSTHVLNLYVEMINDSEERLHSRAGRELAPQ
jgi:hypothetical protein